MELTIPRISSVGLGLPVCKIPKNEPHLFGNYILNRQAQFSLSVHTLRMVQVHTDGKAKMRFLSKKLFSLWRNNVAKIGKKLKQKTPDQFPESGVGNNQQKKLLWLTSLRCSCRSRAQSCGTIRRAIRAGRGTPPEVLHFRWS